MDTSRSISITSELVDSRCFSNSRIRAELRRTITELPRIREAIFGLGCFRRVGCSRVDRVLGADRNTLGTSCRLTIGGVARCLRLFSWAL